MDCVVVGGGLAGLASAVLLAEAGVVHAHVVRMPKSTFAQRPGSAGIRPDQRTAVHGLALAGDWTRTDWTTTMEGAAQSAARAVDVVLSDR